MTVPSIVKGALQRYLCDRIAPGGFLRAVLENDLLTAVMSADSISRETLPEIVNYVYLNVPRDAWGSPARVKDWLTS
jgi:hypothetical protein